MDINSVFELNNGVRMPVLGLGVFRAPMGETTRSAVRTALEYGYRLVDTARIYCNEKSVGRGIRDSGIRREDIFVTTKLWRTNWQEPRRGLEESLERLGLDYVDLYLLHWPFKGYEQAYLELEKLQKEGLCRAIGVSNFKLHHLKSLKEAGATVRPAVNQIECHPYNQEQEMLDYCNKKGIVITAYSPLGGQGHEIIFDPRIASLSSYYKVTPAQLILRWHLQRGIAVIPKSVHQERILENSRLFSFQISEDDMAALASLNKDEKRAFDPDLIDSRPESSYPPIVQED